MAYAIRLPDGTLVENIPDEVTPEAAKVRLLEQFPELRPKSAPFSLKDIGTAFGQGVVGSAEALTNVAGAGNVASKYLGEVSESLGKQYTPERQAEMQRQQARAKKAEESGSTWEEIKAAAQGIYEAPLQSIAQGLGSFVPYAPAMVAGPAAAALGLTGRSLLAAEMVAKAYAPVVGTAQGAGAVKGAIYDAVYKAEKESGVPEEDARQKADAAQEYAGKNLDEIALGGIFGLAASRSGAEKFLTKEGREKAAEKLLPRVGRAVLEESATEGIQGGQERLAANIALQRTGRDVPTWQGVAGQAAQEAIVGGLTAGPVAALGGRRPTEPEAAPPPAVPPSPVAEPSLTGTAPAEMIEALSRPQNADMMAAIRGREEQQAAQAEAQRVEEERATAETKRLEDEAQRVETARQISERERVRAMPGFTGADTTNAGILQAQREKEEAEAVALEKSKEVEYRKIIGTTFSADPLQNFRQQQAALQLLDYPTPEMKPQIPAIYEQIKALSEEPEAPPVTPPVTTVTPPVTPAAPAAVEPIAPVAPPVAPPVVAPIAPPVAPPVIEEQQPVKQDKSLASQPTYTESTVLEVPVPELTLSKDVPQFKSDANQNGVVQATKLEGKFDRRLASPVQVWQRNNGQLEVISGRHRLDLAQRSGEKTIPAQIYKESEGFNADMARMLDIELNVKDGRGKVKDYVSFFKEFGLPKEQARAEGLLNTAIGRQAYEIADAGSPSLIAAHFNKDITDDAATAIAINAPRNEALQNLGMQQVRDGKSINHAVNFMRSAMAAGFKGKEGSGDLFGFDDSFAKEAEAVTKEATKQQREARQQLSAIRGAAKSPEKARLGGVDVKNLEQTQAKIAELEKTINELENFHTNPELYKKLRQAAGLEEGLVSPTPESLKAQEERAKSEEKRIAAEKKEAEDKAKADAEVGEYKLAGSDRAADQDSDQGQMFSLRGKPESQVTAFQETLRNLLNKFGLKDVGVNLIEGMRDEGSYASKLIQIAADSANPIRTLRHESVHALRELGFFTDAQWKSLSKMAKDKWIDQYLKQRNVDGKPLKAGEESRYDAYMREYKGDMEKITEEAVADAFADFESTKPPAGMLQSLLKRLSNLFQSIKSALTKIEAPEQIFTKVEKGALKPEAERAPSESKSLRTSVESLKESAQKFLQKRQPLDREALSDIKDEDFKDALSGVFNPQNKTVIDKVEGMKDGFWRRVAQGVADQYRTIKDYDPVSYMLARLSKTVDGALEGLMLHGHVFNDGGALNIRQNTKGMLEALKPLGKEVDRYQMWIAINRESKLPPEKRSPNISALVPNKDLLVQGTLNGKPRLEVYQSVQKDMNALNKSVLDVALNAGIINSSARDIAEIRSRTDLTDQQKQDKIDKIKPGAYEIFSNDIFYIPFYKEMEDGDVQSSASAAGLDRQKFSAELKGMTDKPFGDLMENTLRNWSHILSASMKNQAANSTVNATMKAGATIPSMKPYLRYQDGVVVSAETGNVIGDGVLRPEQTQPGKGMVKVMRDGHPMYFEVLDPMLLESIISIGYMGPKSKFLEVARDFKNILQFGVTISPTFKVNNLIRDSISAMAVSDLKKNPFANIAEGWIASRDNNPAHISALAGGAVFNFGSTYEGDQARLVKQLIKQGVRPDSILDSPDKIKAGMKLLWDKYQEFGNRSEAANRLALYNQLREKGMSHMEASFQARDLLDFSMQGSWQAFRTVTMVVPFLNARVQGLYKLGRDGITPTTRVLYNTVTGKEITASDRQKAYSFSVTTSAVALASMALYMAFKDDEDFQKRDEWDRDNFWWIKIPGMEYALRVPKPFEVGAFGTLAERTLEQIVDQGSEGKQFGSSIGRMLFDTFALNPTPQMFKPLIDLYANKDSFTGAPIESAGMERLSKQERATDTTSPIAKLVGGMSSFLGEKGELSPVQVDYAIKSYFGWLGATAATTSMYATMPFREGAYPDTVWMDKASLGLIKTLPSNQSRYTTAFYESNKDISQAFADMRHFAEAGESEKVERILEEKGDKIALAKFYDKTAKSMANIRKQIRMITNDESMSGADKREEIDRMKEIISMLAQQAEDTRKAMK